MDIDSILDKWSSKFSTIVDSRLAELNTIVKSLEGISTYKEEPLNLQPGLAKAFHNTTNASALYIVPKNSSDFTNVSIKIDNFTWTFPVGSTQPKIFPMLLPGQTVVFEATAQFSASLYAISSKIAELFGSLQLGTVEVSNTVNVDLVSSSATIDTVDFIPPLHLLTSTIAPLV